MTHFVRRRLLLPQYGKVLYAVAQTESKTLLSSYLLIVNKLRGHRRQSCVDYLLDDIYHITLQAVSSCLKIVNVFLHGIATLTFL